MSTSRGGNYDFNVEDLAVAMIRFDNGATLSVEASFDLNIKDDIGNIELFGTKGGVRVDPELEIYTDVNKYLVNVTPAGSTALSFDGLFEGEIKHYVDCIVNGTPCKSPAEDGIVLMEILDAIYKSAETGHEVVLG